MKKNSNLAKLNNSANNLNNNVRKVVENEIVINIVRVALILYSSFVVPMMSNKQLNLANNQVVRLVVLALVVYLAFMDVVTASLLLVAFLVTLHHSKESSNVGNNNQLVNDVQGQNIMNKINNALNANVENYESMAPSENTLENDIVNGNLGNGNVNVNVLANNGNEFNSPTDSNLAQKLENDYISSYESVEDPNNVPTGFDPEAILSNVNTSKDNNIKDNNIQVDEDILKQPTINNNNVGNKGNNNLLSEEEVNNMIMNQPSSETLTDSILRAQGAEQNVNDPMGLTTGQNLYDASENAVPNSNILDQVKTVKNQFSAQGMDYPFGSGAKRYDGYHYDDAHISHAMLRNEQTSN